MLDRFQLSLLWGSHLLYHTCEDNVTFNATACKVACKVSLIDCQYLIPITAAQLQLCNVIALVPTENALKLSVKGY